MRRMAARGEAMLELAGLTVELVTSRAPWIGEPLASAALDWATTLTGATLPEENAYPRLYSALSALLDAICHAPSARGWATAMVRFELLLLAELGFGLDLSCCAATGQVDDLAYVSPRSARAAPPPSPELCAADLVWCLRACAYPQGFGALPSWLCLL